MTDKPVIVTPELLPCRKCGAICRVETWAASGVLMTETNLWMCGENTLFDGECDGDAYVSAEAWNARTAHAPRQPTAGDDYEQYRPALQASYEITGGVENSPLDDFDKQEIRAGLAFAAAMPSQHSDLADKLEQYLNRDLPDNGQIETWQRDYGAICHLVRKAIPALRQGPAPEPTKEEV